MLENRAVWVTLVLFCPSSYEPVGNRRDWRKLCATAVNAGLYVATTSQLVNSFHPVARTLGSARRAWAHKPPVTAWFNARFSGAATQTVSGVKPFVGGFENDLVSGDTADLMNRPSASSSACRR